MRRFVAVAILVLFVFSGIGCACSDGSNRGWFGATSYAACNFSCCNKGSENDCRCSTACPCWRRHK